jgi:hypothetical protein
MQKANYTTKNIGHYGLGFKDILISLVPLDDIQMLWFIGYYIYIWKKRRYLK